MSSMCSEGANSGAFALVAYLPEPLAGFVDRVRHELAPGCRLRAHITLLPPRQLACDVSIVARELQSRLSHARPLQIQAQDVRVFPVSDVVYLSIGTGSQDLRELHDLLNQGPCLASEAWHYEPHITLAQDLPSGRVVPARDLAQQRWQEYTGPRQFAVDRVAFVKGSPEHGWIDLSTLELHSPVLAL